ncbi:hypothetical protein GCM10025770_38030 [Viridibacterium curvum]|uniref:Pectate lyase domain-containing protein n=1 Tax=Viridibacterium curvum TaxID=1101404 RepID=A0ABP9R666_9RHOO
MYGIRSYSAPVKDSNGHDPANYKVAPKLPTWQFATVDPTGGALTSLECDVAPDSGWHTYRRTSGTAATITHGKVVVTGGRNAAANRIYTVFNGQQLIAAINEAQNEPKIIRVVGHIDLRMSDNNGTFKEYTSYLDQKFGGSIMIPSNTTLVGINGTDGKPARITGTTILVGSELANGAIDAETGFKAWIAAGKDGEDYPTWTRNVIIRNLAIDTPWDVNPEDSGNAYADGVTISRAQNIWVDHVTITDGDTPDSLASDTRHDGALDIVRGSDYVTVSSSFIGDHGKVMLVGNGDSGRAWSDAGRLHVTLNQIWWKGLTSRLPLVRFGQLHTFNTLMEGTTGTATYGHKFEGGLDVRYQSSVFLENSFHYFTGLKPKEVCGKLSGGKDGLGFRVTGAQFISDKTDDGKAWTGGPIDVSAALAAAACAEVPAADIAWTPPYAYTALDANSARVKIEEEAGAGRVGMFSTKGTARSIASGSSSSTSSSSSSATSSASSSTSSVGSSASSSVASSASSSTGVSVAAGVTGTWTESFSASNASAFFTTAYAAQPDDAGKAMYRKTGGTATVASDVLTMAGLRFTVGERGSTGTTATSTPGGIFTINGKTCTLTIDVGVAGSGTGNFQLAVDNNSTSNSNSSSPHGSNSRVVDVAIGTLTVGTHSWTFALNTPTYSGGSFFQLRTESSATIGLNSASLSCN